MSGAELDKIAPFWRTVSLLWKTARLRAKGRAMRQRALMKQRNPKAWVPSEGNFLNRLATIGMLLFMAYIHGLISHQIGTAVKVAAQVASEHDGQVTVSVSTMEDLKKSEPRGRIEQALQRAASERSMELGTRFLDEEYFLKERYRTLGLRGFVARSHYFANLSELRHLPPLAMLCGNGLLLWWLLMLVCQGEGLELDIQRRRHPMWEWLLSHPIRPEAAFLAEMIAPLAVNPTYLMAPVFWMFLLGQVYELSSAIIGGLLIGLTFAFATAYLNKTIELCAMLRLSVRSRGALLGLLSWLGYAAMLIPIFAFGKQEYITAFARWLAPHSHWPQPPVLSWALGNWSGDEFVWWHAVLGSCGFALLLTGGCIALGAWGTQKGLEGGFDSTARAPRMLDLSQRSRFGREPLYRKELLWFWRDRGAMVQAVLIPLTIAAMQAFNLRQVVAAAGQHWNSLCALAIICGTYFLIILGPRSLSSEGPALWLALTWPRGLEDLLKAKARLWWLLSSIIVAAVLVFVAVRFPSDAWKVALVGVGWWFFSRSLAEKAVTLVNAPSSAGEPEPVSRSRQWTAMLGTLAFGSGVMAQNWHLAIIGIVFSSLTAAAMWQNLRARLPFLYDPWSETFPPPPTLMHAMIAIACMVEGVAITSAFITGFGGKETLFVGQAIAYGVAAGITYLIMHRFLARRGVSSAAIWRWPREAPSPTRSGNIIMELASTFPGAAGVTGLCLGLALGLFGIAYRAALWHIPEIAQVLQQHADALRDASNTRVFLVLTTVVFAPIAEEYLFRGMLYRALDREWGGWRAVAGSAAFFAIYHPPLAWLPVFTLGLMNAYLFKRLGRLLPCVLCHMAYNAVVVLTT